MLSMPSKHSLCYTNTFRIGHVRGSNNIRIPPHPFPPVQTHSFTTICPNHPTLDLTSADDTISSRCSTSVIDKSFTDPTSKSTTAAIAGPSFFPLIKQSSSPSNKPLIHYSLSSLPIVLPSHCFLLRSPVSLVNKFTASFRNGNFLTNTALIPPMMPRHLQARHLLFLFKHLKLPTIAPPTFVHTTTKSLLLQVDKFVLVCKRSRHRHKYF